MTAHLRRHVHELFRLAVPVMIARAGLLIMAMTDIALVGQLTATELAALGLASDLFTTLMVIGIGLLFGVLALTAQAMGREDYRAAGAVWRYALPYALLLGALGLVLLWPGGSYFDLLGQQPIVTARAGEVIRILALGLPGALLYVATAFFLEGLHRPLPGMIVMLVAVGLNALSDWVMIFGHWGFPPLGAAGAAWTTTWLRWAMAATLILYALTMSDQARFGLRGGFSRWWRRSAPQRRLGYAASISYAFETWAFFAMQLFSGWIGITAQAAYSVTTTTLALAFMVAVGMASATSVRVGIAHGRGDTADMALAGMVGLGATMALMALIGIPVGLAAPWLAATLTPNAEVAALATSLLVLLPFVMPLDGGQNVALGALRGAGDAWIPTGLHFLSYFAVMVPIAYGLAFGLGHGVRGIYEAILIASAVAVTTLALRFRALTRRPRAPAQSDRV